MTLVPYINDIQLGDILSCIRQMTETKGVPNIFFVINVWFPEPANLLLKAETPEEGYCVFCKFEGQYRDQLILQRAKEIWNSGKVPVEVIQTEGTMFFSLDRESLFLRHYISLWLDYAE